MGSYPENRKAYIIVVPDNETTNKDGRELFISQKWHDYCGAKPNSDGGALSGCSIENDDENTDIRLAELEFPQNTFRTAVRSVDHVEDIIVEIHTDEGAIGYGEAPPTGRVTGDTKGAIVGAMRDHLIPALMGRSVEDFNELLDLTQGAIQHNTSAKAAMEIALYDLLGQMLNAPVYRLLGGSGAPITTDITISVNEPDEMVRDSLNAVSRGYKTLKIKVGNDAAKDMARMKAIRAAIGSMRSPGIDANQGWKPKEAVSC